MVEWRMSLNIKNEEAHRLAAEIAQRTGKSLTEVVLVSLREKHAQLAAEDRRARARRTVNELRQLLASASLPDHGELLYDPQTGLPR